MKTPVDLLFAPVLSHAIENSPSRPTASSPSPKNAMKASAVATVIALLSLMSAGRLSAQDYWPPDDDPGPGEPQQQYPSSPQYAEAQPEYPQSPYGSQQQPYAQGYPQQSYQQGYGQQLSQNQPVSPEQLTQLVAPIALYPDNLVAQILAASTYPGQIAAADQWLRSMGSAPPEQVAAAADAQSNWDPSIKGLTAFPQVVQWLAGNLQWTTSLGNAYYNQPQDVLQTIQVMRQRAEDAGNLQSTPQEQVSENQGAIDIAPADPQTVYVPTYNPWNAYGAPVDPYPNFSLLGTVDSFFGSSAVQFGLSFAMNAFLHTPWGFLGWGLDWLGHSILFDHNSYFTHSRSVSDWGFPHGGPRAYPGNPQYAHGGYGGDRGGWNRYGSSMRSGYAPRYGGPSPTYRAPSQNFNRYGQNYGRSPYGDARSSEGFNRGFPPRLALPSRSPQEAYNRYPQPITRAPQFGGSSRAYDPSRSYGYGNRGGMGYGGPSSQYRAPQSRMPENNYRGSSGAYDSYRGNQFARSQSSGGGFHLFGNHNSDSFSGGRSPKSYSFGGGGHSSWGGGGGSFKAPHESHFGGGGHSGGGGGHWGGGGHSSGGSSGGHSGHHH